MYLIEFTKSNVNSLSEILLGICVNSNKTKVNKDTTYIIAQDLKKYNPTRLIHTYDKEELKNLLESIVTKYPCELVCKEIIPTDYNIGIVRTLKFNKDNLVGLLEQLFIKNRYYLNCKYTKGSQEVSCVITFNPSIRELESENIRLSSSLIINASTLQCGKIDDFKRVMHIKNTIPESDGTYTIYVSEGE